ncbi:MAG: BtpA/SgcQ family protein [Planctomycetota bacterium]|nr:BtpA/SgcQ family protein [Planctomycetota bacterium]
MTSARDIFGRQKALIGMIHVQALPGTPGAPGSGLSVKAIAEQAVEEARILINPGGPASGGGGFDALLLENMHDVPYLLREVGPEIVAAMTAVGAAVRDAVGDVPLGIQILAGANRAALAVAHAIGAHFIRAEGFVFASIADEGLLAEADAGPLLRYRRMIGAEDVKILADIKKKHSSHAITGDLPIAETAKAAAFFGADGVIVTGAATAQPTAPEEVKAVREAVDSASLGGSGIPVLVGSGVTPDTAPALLQHADALIVGSWFKKDGHWRNAPDPARARRIVQAVRP